MTKKRPTKKQKEMLGFIENFIAGHGYGPSYREIMRGLGYKSVSTVASHIDNLIARGHLVKKDNSARSLELIGAIAPDEPMEIKSYDKKPADKTKEVDDLLKLVDKLFLTVEHKDIRTTDDLNQLATVVRALEHLGYEKAARYKSRYVLLASPGA